MFRLIYKRSLLFAVIWALIIFILCATPGQYIPSANWLELLSFDKWVHASIFFILTALVLLNGVKYTISRKGMFVWFSACVAYGALLEFMQATCFSNRSADWKDIVANSFGCLMAFLLLGKIKKWEAEWSLLTRD
jgi:VanZ family protein